MSPNGNAKCPYRTNVHRQLFWPLVAFGALLLMLAGATFAAALFSIELPSNIGLVGGHAFLGRVTSLSWSADHSFLIATAGFAVTAVIAFAVAAHAR
jgi:hypothetical protein